MMGRQRVFITGGTGFIGRHLASFLADAEFDVSILTRRKGAVKDSRIKLVRGSVEETESYVDILEQTDTVIHLAGNAKFGNGNNYKLENTENTDKLISAIKSKSSSIKLIFFSTIGVIDRKWTDSCSVLSTESSPLHPSSDYGRSKLEAERSVRNSGLDYVILRPALVIGADMRFNSHFSYFIRMTLQKGLFSRLGFPGDMSVIHVNDVCMATQHIMDSGITNEIYNLKSHDLSLRELNNLVHPGRWQVNLTTMTYLLRPFIYLLPFKLKCLFYGGLAVSNDKLKSTGWTPALNKAKIFNELLHRELARTNPSMDPGGHTIVTGAASGLGLELSQLLMKTNRKLILIDKKFPNNKFESGNSLYVEMDLSDRDEIEKLVQRLHHEGIKIAEIFLCAGIGFRGTTAALEMQKQVNTIDVNLTANFLLTHFFLEGMISRQFGRIILISSSSAFQPLPMMNIYASTKVALLYFGEALASELEDQGVNVLTICPGGMKTNFQKSGGVKENNKEVLDPPDLIAKRILSALGGKTWLLIPSRRAFYMSMLARVLPRKVSVKMWGRLMEKLR
jgi:short-subunit dehydrogenase